MGRRKRDKEGGSAPVEGSTRLWYESMVQWPWLFVVLLSHGIVEHAAEANYEVSYSTEGLIVHQPDYLGEEGVFFAWADIDRIEPLTGFFASIELVDGSCYRLEEQHGGLFGRKAARRFAVLERVLRQYKPRARPVEDRHQA